jgi:hypothetical protein
MPVTPAVLALEVRHAPDDLSRVRSSHPVLGYELRSLRRAGATVRRLWRYRQVPGLRDRPGLGTGLRDVQGNAPLPDLRGPQTRLGQDGQRRATTINPTARFVEPRPTHRARRASIELISPLGRIGPRVAWQVQRLHARYDPM